MKAQDLRLDNLVMFRGKICKVTTLSGDIIRVDEPEVGIIEQAYPKSPIELTPEVLEACGFEVEEHTPYDIRIKIEGITISFVLGKDGIFVGKYKHLHQLQNLYHSLTGEELTISLPTVKMEEV